MTLLDAEVAGETAAAAESLDAGTGPGQQRHVGLEAHDRGLVAVGLDDDGRSGEVRRVPAVRTAQQLGQGEDALRDVDGPGVVEELDCIGSQDAEA